MRGHPKQWGLEVIKLIIWLDHLVLETIKIKRQYETKENSSRQWYNGKHVDQYTSIDTSLKNKARTLTVSKYFSHTIQRDTI